MACAVAPWVAQAAGEHECPAVDAVVPFDDVRAKAATWCISVAARVGAARLVDALAVAECD
jgi:hypothetical protein